MLTMQFYIVLPNQTLKVCNPDLIHFNFNCIEIVLNNNIISFNGVSIEKESQYKYLGCWLFVVIVSTLRIPLTHLLLNWRTMLTFLWGKELWKHNLHLFWILMCNIKITKTKVVMQYPSITNKYFNACYKRLEPYFWWCHIHIKLRPQL